VAPVAFIGVVASAVAVAIWPQPEYTAAVPAPVATPTQTASASASARVSRGEPSRPAVKSSPSAKAFRAKPSAKEKPPTFAPSSRAPSPRAAAKSVSLTATGIRYTTTGVNVRTEPSVDGNVITVLSAGSKVSTTSGAVPGWAAILHDEQRRWVRSEYLSSTKPSISTPSATSNGISYAPCQSGSGVESGLTPDAIRVHRAICARFPQVTSYHGVRADSLPYHPSGRALDAMISDSTIGWQIANYVRANASRLGASEVIYAQSIWTVQRSSEGWRSMSDRGSATANHYDHVHVTVYGYSGSG
jgi:Bacterial SH3 domain